MKNAIKLTFSIISAICLVCAMMTGCTSPAADTSTSTTTQPTESSTTQSSTGGTLDWNMEGYHVAQDGTVSDPINFTMSGEIGNNNDIHTALTLEIDLPENFPYAIQVNEFYCHNKDLKSFQFYVMTNFCLDKNALEDKPAFIALDVSKGYAAFVWPDQSVLYASAAKDTALDSIVQHFEKFVRACGSSQSTTTPPDSNPVVQELDKTMYFTSLSESGQATASYQAHVNVTLTDQNANTIDVHIDRTDGSSLGIDNENEPFVITMEYENLPYYCAIGHIYDPTTDGWFPYVLAVDFENELLILKENSNITSCTVASADADTPPLQIREYFQRFIELFAIYAPPFGWKLNAFYVTDNETVLDSFSYILRYNIKEDPKQADNIPVHFALPEDFPYEILSDEIFDNIIFFKSISDDMENIDYYITNTEECINKQTGETTQIQMAFSKEMEYVLFYWPEDPGKYLVAAADETATPQQILSYFEYFLQTVNTE